MSEQLPEYTVREGIWDAETKIGKVHRFRHTCIWDGQETKVTFCNNCGGVFTWGGGQCCDCGMVTDGSCS